MDAPHLPADALTRRARWSAHIALGGLNLYLAIWLIGLLRVLFSDWQGEAFGVTMADFVASADTLDVAGFFLLTGALQASQVLLAFNRNEAIITMSLALLCLVTLWLRVTDNPVHDGPMGMLVIGWAGGVLILLLLIRSRRRPVR